MHPEIELGTLERAEPSLVPAQPCGACGARCWWYDRQDRGWACLACARPAPVLAVPELPRRAPHYPRGGRHPDPWLPALAQEILDDLIKTGPRGERTLVARWARRCPERLRVAEARTRCRAALAVLESRVDVWVSDANGQRVYRAAPKWL